MSLLTLPEELEKHAGRVARLAELVARQLDAPVDLEDLRLAARLHDVGMVAVPAELTSGPGPLDEVAWRLVRWHPLVGERMLLQAAPWARAPAVLIRFSHERWDGFGYPDGLVAEAIPLGARVIFACAAFDALTSERPYRDLMSAPAAFRELRRHAGTQFDPDVVEALGEVVGCR